MKSLLRYLPFVYYLIAWALFSTVLLRGQSTTVTATVVDSDGTTWANGTASIQFVPSPTQPQIGKYTFNGLPLAAATTNQGPTTLGAGGNLNFVVYDSSQVSPIGSQWQITVCPNASFKCSVYLTPLTGSSVNISTSLTATIQAPRFQALPGSYGYNDTEAQIQLITGAIYYNVTSSVNRQWNGSSWTVQSSNATTINGASVPGTISSSPVTLPTMITAGLPMVNIKHPSFGGGAKCDNSTDDTAALQAAVTAINTTGGGILIPGTFTTPCYFANPTEITWGNSSAQQITLYVQGEMRTGTMFVHPPNVNVVGYSGGNSSQFQAGGQQAIFQGPTTLTTLGTSVSTGSQTFTPGSTAGMAVNGYLTVVSQTSCTATTGTAAANTVVFQLSGSCHIPAGFNAVIAGTTDSNSNGTFLISQDDYFNNTLSVHCTACVNSTGGTITGPNEDTMENVLISAISGGNVTAFFSYAHASTDSVGTVGYQVLGGSHHDITNMTFNSAGGTALLIGGQVASCCGDATDNVQITHSSANGGSAITAGAVEIDNAVDIRMEKFVTSVTNGFASWGLRLTNPTMIVGSTGGTGLITIHDSVIRGGMKIDNYTICCGLTWTDSISEETRRGVVTVQPNVGGTGTLYGNKIDNVFIQDNFHFYSLSEIYYTTPVGILSSWNVSNNQSGTGAGAYSMMNANFDGNIESDLAMQTAANQFGSSFNGRSPTILRSGPIDLDMESREEGANLGPSIIPYASQAVPNSPSSWSGTNCSVATGITDPGGNTNAGTITQSGGSNPFLTLFTYIATSSVVGDYILYGGWVKGAAGSGSIQLGNSFQQQLVYDAPNTVSYDSSYGMNDEWHAVAALSKITGIGGGLSHPLLTIQCSAGISLYMPFMIYIPASASIPQQELMRWRKALLHAVVPASSPAVSLEMDATHKLYWGGDTNLYRNSSGVVKTDGGLIVGSVSTSPSTAPICPNGTGGAFTTVGCVGAASLSYTSPTLNAIPKVTNATSPGTLGNSACTDNSTIVACTEPVQSATFQSSGAMAITTGSNSNLTVTASGTGVTTFNAAPSGNGTVGTTYNDNFATISGNFNIPFASFAPSVASGAHIQILLGHDSSAGNDIVDDILWNSGNLTWTKAIFNVNLWTCTTAGICTFANSPLAPTPAETDLTTKVATTTFVNSRVRHQMYWNVQSALFSTSTVLSAVYLEDVPVTLKAVTARLTGTISCTVAPTVNILDLGTSVSTAYGSGTSITTLATGTSDGAFSAAGLNGSIAAGHYVGMGFSAGTCVTAPTMDITAEIQ